MKIPYGEVAELTRGDRDTGYAGRTDDLLATCPECGKKDDVLFLATDVACDGVVDMRNVVAWCPCGCLFVVDQQEAKRVYSFFTHK